MRTACWPVRMTDFLLWVRIGLCDRHCSLAGPASVLPGVSPRRLLGKARISPAAVCGVLPGRSVIAGLRCPAGFLISRNDLPPWWYAPPAPQQSFLARSSSSSRCCYSCRSLIYPPDRRRAAWCRLVGQRWSAAVKVPVPNGMGSVPLSLNCLVAPE